jgi:hypothetical protein
MSKHSSFRYLKLLIQTIRTWAFLKSIDLHRLTLTVPKVRLPSFGLGHPLVKREMILRASQNPARL